MEKTGTVSPYIRPRCPARSMNRLQYPGGMRWFTRAWRDGDLGDAYDYQAVIDAYWTHIQELVPTVPPCVRDLAHVNLHDGRFEEVAVDPQRQTITLRLVAGDLQQGYFSLELSYDDAVLTGMEIGDFKRMIQHPKTEILYDEIDRLASGHYEQRFLMWPHGEFAIRFGDVGLSCIDTTAHEYTAAVGRFTLLHQP
jgi:hypothetical protein